jgi:radical SAM protein with 4Fe4S-binding SPASM domain
MAGSLQRELDNFLAIVHDVASGAESWDARPAWLEFAPNNVCNLRCIMCGQADGLPLQVMPKERAVEVLDQVLANATLLSPTALSEPMLANMKLMVQKCREHGVWLNFHSNATVLNGARLEEIADRVHQLFISFDSPDKATFETLRARADFDQVVRNVREILPVARKHSIPVGFVAVFMRHNAAQMPALVDFLADLGAAANGATLRLQAMLDNARSLRDGDPRSAYSAAQLLAFVDATAARARARGLNLNVDLPPPLARQVIVNPPALRGVLPDLLLHTADFLRRKHPRFCAMAAYYMKILPNGDVFPCCRGPEELKMGNTNTATIEEIWNGDRYRDFRRRMHAGDYPDVCSTCSILVDNPAFAAATATGARAGATAARSGATTTSPSGS